MKPINTALCSFGMSGYVFHAPFIEVHPAFNLYGVWERTKNNAQAKYPNIKTFRTLEEMLADQNIELVVVNTPSVTHYDFAKQAINSGKNVVVEKPFTATVEQAEELILLAKEKNVALSVYHNRRYDLGSHLIDQALVLFGMPNAVFADLDTYRPNSKVGDYFDIKLFYSTHRVILKSSYYVREALPGNIMNGTKGTFIKSKADIQEAELQAGKIPGSKDWGAEPDKEKGLLHTEKDGKIIREQIPTLNGDYMEYYEGIYQALRNNGLVPVTGTEGMEVIRVIEAALKSNREKKVIDL